jgi:hypothetical protein
MLFLILNQTWIFEKLETKKVKGSEAFIQSLTPFNQPQPTERKTIFFFILLIYHKLNFFQHKMQKYFFLSFNIKLNLDF